MSFWILLSAFNAPVGAQPAPANNRLPIPQLIEEIISSGNYQLEFPDDSKKTTPVSKPKETQKSERTEKRREEPAEPARSVPNGSVTEGNSSDLEFLRYLLWGVGVIIAAIFLFFLITDVPVYLRRRKSPTETDDRELNEHVVEPIPSEVILSAVGEADNFADQQDFTRGIRHLLLHAFDMLRKQFGTQLAPFLTNREVLAHLPLSRPEKRHLQVIVAAEELSQFGARQPNKEIYDNCRENLSRFAQLMDRKEE